MFNKEQKDFLLALLDQLQFGTSDDGLKHLQLALQVKEKLKQNKNG